MWYGRSVSTGARKFVDVGRLAFQKQQRHYSEVARQDSTQRDGGHPGIALTEKREQFAIAPRGVVGFEVESSVPTRHG
jgi:hypothetical protein